ncbi:hypothetical protein BKA62DRAFT_624379 [Auriculariales sp. MPI-PUGE-AT-0066]|nr:hypothetical protein BKA62DRAFT_624379 [Auriculariales sp. MPI-PUGE-AT-0066]
MSTPSPSILIFGATGYIGGAMLMAVLKAFPTAKVSAIVRHNTHDAVLTAAGVASVLHHDGGSSKADIDALQNAVSGFDVVVNAADANDVVLVDAIITGLKARKERTGKRAVFLHTAGVLVVADAAQGEWDPDFLYISDMDEAALRAIPPTAINREIELRVYEADAAQHIDGYQICPGGVWGTSPDAPVRKDSVRLLQMYRAVFGKGLVIGSGTNRMATVHVADLADLAVLVLRRALSGAKASSYGKYYFAATSEVQQRDVAAVVVKALVQLDELDVDVGVKNVSVEEASTHLNYAFALAVNSAVRAERGLGIGWNPSRLGSSTENMADQLRPIVGV